MTKIRKQKRRKRYRYNVNRKRMNKKKLPNPQSLLIKKSWKENISCQQNLKAMGLVYDVNKEIEVKENYDKDKDFNVKAEAKSEIAKQLEEEAERSYTGKGHGLPKGQVEYLIYLLNKYGEDYKAMARDKSNVIQATWKQIRAKVKLFQSIPEQYNEYLKCKTS